MIDCTGHDASAGDNENFVTLQMLLLLMMMMRTMMIIVIVKHDDDLHNECEGPISDREHL